MKYLELTEQKANDLNSICLFAISRGVNSSFDPVFFQLHHNHFDIFYIYHLLDVARQYLTSNKIIDLSTREICATYNTEPFLNSGGFLRILKIEKREDEIQDYTRRNLKQSIFATKDWWVLFVITFVISALISITTNLSTDKLLKRNSLPNTTQDSLLKSLTAYILHQDSLSYSYKKSLEVIKTDSTK